VSGADERADRHGTKHQQRLTDVHQRATGALRLMLDSGGSIKSDGVVVSNDNGVRGPRGSNDSKIVTDSRVDIDSQGIVASSDGIDPREVIRERGDIHSRHQSGATEFADVRGCISV
jgi:hypothetical protein